MDEIKMAFKVVQRADFLPPSVRPLAGADAPLAIGYGQTNSQPTTVRMMLEWLTPQSGNKILDVGSGSGWTTALLSYLVGSEGKVVAVERIPELLQLGKQHCQKVGVNNATFHLAGTEIGLSEDAPYDRILVCASAKVLPVELLDQLAFGGKLVVPVLGTVMEITKISNDEYESVEHPGFHFVPLVEK